MLCNREKVCYTISMETKEILREQAHLNDKCAVFATLDRSEWSVKSVLDNTLGLTRHTPWTSREEAQFTFNKFCN